MAKQGFGGQWIDLLKVTKAIDSTGVERDLTPELLQAIVTNFNAARIEAPITIGHPKKGDPAYGWIPALRLEGNTLQMLTEDTDDEFENMIRMGRFKTRSAGILTDHPTLKTPTIDHVAFLGAEPPAVKGLRNIQFTETRDGDSFAVETTINLQEKKMEEKDLDQLPESFWDKFKSKLGISKTEFKEGGNPAPQPAAFTLSEASIKSMLAEAAAEATKTAKAEFAEELKTRDEKIAALTSSADANSAAGRRAAIVSFVESIPAEKGKHFLKRAGVVEFMEGLAAADAEAGDKKIVSFSEGEGDKKVDHNFSLVDWFKTYVDAQQSFIQFGEKFGSLTATDAADALVDPTRVSELTEKMTGKKAAAGGEK